MLKKTQHLIIALAVTAIFAACQKDDVNPVNEDPALPEQPNEPIMPKWEKIAGIPENKFVSLAMINNVLLALDNQHLYSIDTENWTFSKTSFENPNSPNVNRTPVTHEFFASVKGSEIVVYSTSNPQAKGKIDINDFFDGNFSLTAAYPFAPRELAINHKNEFLLVFSGDDSGISEIPYLVSFKAQMAPVDRVEFKDVKITKMDDVLFMGNYNLIYPVGDNFILSMGVRTFSVSANGNWEEIIRAPLLSIIPYNDRLIGFGQPSGNVWLSDTNGEDWSNFSWKLNITPFLVNPKGIQIEDYLIQEVPGGLALVHPGFSDKPFDFIVFDNEDMGLPKLVFINDFIKTDSHVVMATDKGIYICPIKDFIPRN